MFPNTVACPADHGKTPQAIRLGTGQDDEAAANQRRGRCCGGVAARVASRKVATGKRPSINAR
jgi:hypothetical protein